MAAQGENEVARMANWSQRVNKEIQGALDWYKEWGIIFQAEHNSKPPSLDELIRQKEAALRKYVCHCGVVAQTMHSLVAALCGGTAIFRSPGVVESVCDQCVTVHTVCGLHVDRKSTRLNSSHPSRPRMPSSA